MTAADALVFRAPQEPHALIHDAGSKSEAGCMLPLYEGYYKGAFICMEKSAPPTRSGRYNLETTPYREENYSFLRTQCGTDYS